MTGLLAYALQVTLTRVVAREFRQQVLQVLVDLYATQAEPDHLAVAQCLFFLNDAPKVAEVLNSLLRQNSDVRFCLLFTLACRDTRNDLHFAGFVCDFNPPRMLH